MTPDLFNIDDDAINDTAEMPLRKADGSPRLTPLGLACSITFYGPGTSQFSHARNVLEERATQRRMAAMMNNGNAPLTAEQKARERAEFLASVTVSFNNFGRAGLTGRPLFMAVYSDPKLGHIADQADKWVAERGNFLPQSSDSSAFTFAN